MKRYLVPPGVQAKDLIAMTVHDLRTPVTAIKGFSQLALRQDDLPPAARQHLDMVISEANRITALIDDLVLLGDLEKGDEAVHLRAADLAELLFGILRDAPRLGLAGRCAIAPGLPRITARCDPNLLERAIANLTWYALKFTTRNEPVRLAAGKSLEGPWLTVSTGHDEQNGYHGSVSPGRPDEGRETGVSRPVDLNPRGLGMYIATKLIELQGGQLWIETFNGAGARLSVLLSKYGQSTTPSKGGNQQWS
jgi:signal transduction histidine kinase